MEKPGTGLYPPFVPAGPPQPPIEAVEKGVVYDGASQ